MSCYGGQGQGLLHTRPSHLLGEIQKTTNDAGMIKIMMMKRPDAFYIIVVQQLYYFRF